MINGKMK